MHKSIVFTFGLLASSLVMFAAMPFLNNNSFFSNTAMAQGYDADYYGDSSYSKYPTDDKKYECRTGPLEGFFTSSVEFCKFNIFDKDDRKDIRDNKVGPQGPPGPAGATGATGPRGFPGIDGTDGINGTNGINGTQGLPGPAGITELNDTNTYFVIAEANTTFSNNPNAKAGFAICDEGDSIISGGYNALILDNSFISYIVDNDNPTSFGSTGAWSVTIIGESQPIDFTVFAKCFDNPPLR